MNVVLKILKERRSIRRYKAEQIKKEELSAILEAGTFAPTGMGQQAAVMVVIQDPDTIKTLSAINAAVMNASGTDPFYGAPTVVAVLADTNSYNWLKDGSLVMGNLMNAAAALGVGSCWINRCDAVFEREEGKPYLAKWGLGENYKGVGFCILGYPEGEIPAPKARKENYIIFD